MNIVFSQEDLERIVDVYLKPLLDEYKTFIFKGPLGAGKTTTIKQILKSYGVENVVTSPTFTYVNSYKGAGGKSFNHFDLYRIASIDGFFELGFDEYLYHNNEWNFIEWPEVIESLLNEAGIRENVCVVELEYATEDPFKRRLRVIPLSKGFHLETK